MRHPLARTPFLVPRRLVNHRLPWLLRLLVSRGDVPQGDLRKLRHRLLPKELLRCAVELHHGEPKLHEFHFR